VLRNVYKANVAVGYFVSSLQHYGNKPLIGLVLLCVSIIVGACAATPQPTNTPLPPTIISGLPTSAIQTRPTLPPSWTPTPTSTETPIPSATSTPTITPTLSLEDICASVLPAQIYNYGTLLLIVVETTRPEISMRLLFTNRDNDESFEVQIPGGRQIMASLDVKGLPGAGVYDWELTAATAAQADLCQQTGTFEIVPPSLLEQLRDLLAELGIGVNPTPLPEITAEATAEVTPESTQPAD